MVDDWLKDEIKYAVMYMLKNPYTYVIVVFAFMIWKALR